MIIRFKSFLWLLFTGLMPGLLTISCNRHDNTEKIIITCVPDSDSSFSLKSAGERYIRHSSLVMVDKNRPASNEVLTRDFYSACSPDVSWDGQILLFAAQKNENDTWQIWKMDLKTREIAQITKDSLNCTDPVSMPSGRIVYSRLGNLPSTEVIELFSVNTDGTDSKQLTFHPHKNLATSILKDGRLISVTQQLIPVKDNPYLMVLRPDGTKADLFYRGKPHGKFPSRVRESNDGKIFFIETDSLESKGMIVSVNYNRPLHTTVNYTESLPGSFIAAYPGDNGKMLAAYRNNENETFALYEFDTGLKKPGDKIFSATGMNIIDIVVVKEQTRPKKLPSEVDPGVKTGLLLCQDLNFTGMGTDHDPKTISHRIEVAGIDSGMGKIHAEKDGSLYLKIIADKPFRIRKLDADNNTISESGWIYLRPNERRGCIGCHENPELAPENRVPLSIKSDPVSVPVNVSGILEKEVELE